MGSDSLRSSAFHGLRRFGDRRSLSYLLGSDGLLVCNESDEPVLATLAEKLAVILLASEGVRDG